MRPAVRSLGLIDRVVCSLQHGMQEATPHPALALGGATVSAGLRRKAVAGVGSGDLGERRIRIHIFRRDCRDKLFWQSERGHMLSSFPLSSTICYPRRHQPEDPSIALGLGHTL